MNKAKPSTNTSIFNSGLLTFIIAAISIAGCKQAEVPNLQDYINDFDKDVKKYDKTLKTKDYTLSNNAIMVHNYGMKKSLDLSILNADIPYGEFWVGEMSGDNAELKVSQYRAMLFLKEKIKPGENEVYFNIYDRQGNRVDQAIGSLTIESCDSDIPEGGFLLNLDCIGGGCESHEIPGTHETEIQTCCYSHCDTEGHPIFIGSLCYRTKVFPPPHSGHD